MSLFSLQAPYYRVERAIDPNGDLRILVAPDPAHGWPAAWLFVPVQSLDKSRKAHARPAADERFHWRVNTLHWLPFRVPQEEGDRRAPLSRAQRLSLPQAWCRRRAGGRQDLLCLLLYRQDGQIGLPDQGLDAGAHAGALRDAVADCLAHRSVRDLGHGLIRWPRNAPPKAQGHSVNFLLASCQFPPHLLDRAAADATEPLHSGLAESSLARLVRYCEEHPRGRRTPLLLLAGDAIYADPTFGLFDPRNAVERFDRRYDRLKSGVLKHLPPTLERIVSAPDDHEFEENLERALSGRPLPASMRMAREAAWNHSFDPLLNSESRSHFWHEFEHQGAAFFVADTRTERDDRDCARAESAHLMPPQQRQAITRWLERTQGRPRFFMSAAMFLPRRKQSAEHASGSLRSDAWCGYPASLNWLLGEIWRLQADHLVFLSGDEHRSGWVQATLEEAPVGDACQPLPCGAAGAQAAGQRTALTLYSIHSSALYSPWGFTVSDPLEWAAPDAWCFSVPKEDPPAESSDAPRRLRCSVGPWHDHPGDGFLAFQWRRDALRWWFSRAQTGAHPSDPGPRHRTPDAQIRWADSRKLASEPKRKKPST